MKKRFLSLLISMAMVLSLCCGLGFSASAAEVSVSLPWKTITISKGKSVTLTPEVSGKKDYTLEWSTSDKNVVSVTSQGKVTGVKNGSATVTVKVKGTKAKASVEVTVGTKVSSVTVPDSSITLKKGGTYTVKPTVSPSKASNKKLSYSTSDKSVATVSSKGVITAVKAGTAKITVKSTDGSGKKAVITVKVTSTGKSDTESSTGTSSKKPSAKATKDFDTKMTSMDIVKDMGAGWNLGNSLDALGTGLNSETAWGNPKTTKDMIDDICKAGFKTIRIPVSWGKHCDSKGNVDKDWMKRVKEVVDYAYSNGVYVILNSHHDNSYYDIGGCVKSEETLNRSVKKMTTLWTQIANTFKDYDEHLIFETLNEPRTEGSAKEWSGGTAEEREVVYTLNEKIVAAIRKTGGNNAYRHIMVPAYAATSSTNILKQLELPDDDRIIVSVHAYNPYFFAMDANGSGTFTDNDKKELDKFFKELNSIFVSKGIPVVIGEFGATNKNNLEDRVAWAKYYVSGAGKYNIPCVLWDNNSGRRSGGECFGIYSREKKAFNYPEIVEAIVQAAK
ncbi:MAG: cellulase family glycosylhydrolase [Huintestinicola sp.]|uniref:cellulase family glycosylhydrolase n=1 Tax=Huintestinicola sp. TaxID=2981661 RepID=UPI003F0BFF86